MIRQPTYEDRDQQVDEIVRRVLAQKQASFSPQKTKHLPIKSTLQSLNQTLGIGVTSRTIATTSLYQTIPNQSLQNHQLQTQNFSLQKQLAQLVQVFNKTQKKKEKHHQRIQETRQLEKKLQHLLKSNRIIEKDLNELRVSRLKSNSLMIQQTKINNKSKRHSGKNCCCKYRFEYNSKINHSKLKSSEKQTLVQPRNKSIKGPTQSNILSRVGTDLHDSAVQCALDNQSEIRQDQERKQDHVKTQRIYIESLGRIIEQQQKVLKDYESQFESIQKMNKPSDTGRFIKANKSRSNLKRTINNSTSKKLPTVQSMLGGEGITSRIKNSPSVGTFVKTHRKPDR